MSDCVRLAMFKGTDDWTDRLIRLWTRSDYSHCELVMPNNDWITASGRDRGVRLKQIEPDPSRWDFIDIPYVSEASVRALYAAEKGAGYDWMGILTSQFLPIGIQSDKDWFCSEFCAKAMGLMYPQRYSPGQLAEVARWAHAQFNV